MISVVTGRLFQSFETNNAVRKDVFFFLRSRFSFPISVFLIRLLITQYSVSSHVRLRKGSVYMPNEKLGESDTNV